MNYIFVYGTLKKGRGNHYLLNNQSFMGKGTIKGNYKMFVNRIPFLTTSPEFDIKEIKGELYSVSNEALDNLDMLEGHPFAYKREQVIVHLNDETSVISEAYLYPYEVLKLRDLRYFEESVDF